MKRKSLGSNLIIVFIAFYLLIPLLLTFSFSAFKEWTNVLPSGFTLRFYGSLLSDFEFLKALVRTILISVVPVVIIISSMVLVMYVTTLYIPWLNSYIANLSNIPYALQGVILSISIIGLYSSAPGIFSNRIVLLIGAYCIMVLPYIYRGLQNSLNGINAIELVDAAQMLGASKFIAFIKIILPLMKSGILISAMLSISIIFGDFVIVNTVAGSYYPTAMVYLYKLMERSGQESSALIVILFITTLLLSTGMLILENKSKQKGEME